MDIQRIILLIPCHSLEDFPVDLEESEAGSLLSAWSIAFHPAILACSGSFPQWSRADSPPEPQSGDLVLSSTLAASWMPSDYRNRLTECSGQLFEASDDRHADLQQLLRKLELDSATESECPIAPGDFLAFGTIWLIGEVLARQMRHFHLIEETTAHESLLKAAQHWQQGEFELSKAQLTDAFGQLQEKREQFYPIDPLFVDHLLIDEQTTWDDLQNACHSKTPLSLQLTGDVLQALFANVTGDQQQQLIAAIEKNGHCLIGGMQTELVNQLHDLDHLQQSIEHGQATFAQAGLPQPKIWASRTFGLCSQLPQVLHDYGYIAALHNAIDDGLFPAEEQSHYRWEARDGRTISTNSRLPLPGQTASGLLQLPQQLPDGMDHDHVAMISWMRVPGVPSVWLDDLKAASRYPCVLGKFVNWVEFFEQTEDNGHPNQTHPFEYRTSWLTQAVGKRQDNPISHWQQTLSSSRTQKSASIWNETLKLFGTTAASQSESSDCDLLFAQLSSLTAASNTDSEAKGTLLINPSTHAQKARVVFPYPPVKGDDVEFVVSESDASDSYSALVTVPGHSFRWIAAEKSYTPHRGKKSPPLAEQTLLRNEFFTVSINPQSGGIEQVKTYDRSPNRLSQQLAFHFNKPRQQLVDEDSGKTKKVNYSIMRAKERTIVRNDSTVGAIQVQGLLFDPETRQPIAEFSQRIEIRRGERTIRVSIDLTPKESCGPYPWNSYYCSRFAWSDPHVELSGAIQQGTTTLQGEQFESIDYVRWGSSGHSATLYAQGRPFYRICEPRKIDALMSVRGEQSHHFEYVIAIDEPSPMKMACQLTTPLLSQHNVLRPAREAGWFWHINYSNVQLTRFQARYERHPDSSVVELLETDGFHRVVTLSCPKPVATAVQINASGHQCGVFAAEGRKVKVEINQYEHVRIQLNWA